MSFGNQIVGTTSQEQTITLGNTGPAPLLVQGISLTGAEAGEFTVTDLSGTSIGPGESRTLSIHFSPAARGSRSATLSITSNAPGSPSTIALSGNGIAPVVRLSPAALDFGRQPEGLSGDLALLLQNNGDAPLTVGRIAFQGANAGDFSLATDGVSGQTLQPGDIVLINVRFTPTATGSRAASLLIADDATGSPQSVALTGTGTAPLLTLSADSLIFGVQPSSSTQTLVLTNGGDAPLAISGVGLDGPNAGSFQIVSDTGQPSLAVGASRTLTIAFNSASIAGRRGRSRNARIAATSYSAILEIADNDPHPGAPHQVALTALAAGAPTPAATAPAAPTNLTAVVTPANQVTLTWTSNSNNETAFAIWRQTGSGAFVRVGVVPPHTTQFTDTGLTPNTPYTYEVRATNNTGASAWTNTATAALTPPAAPTDLTASPAGPQIVLTWTSHSDNETAFAIWRQTGTGPFGCVGVVPPHSTSFRDRSAVPSTTYTYQVRAINNVGASAWSPPATVTSWEAAPGTPTGLTVTVGPAGAVELTWTAGGGNATGVSIFRQASGGAWERIGVVAPGVTRYADRSAQPGTRYTYQVRAHNSHLVSAWSNAASGVTPAAP